MLGSAACAHQAPTYSVTRIRGQQHTRMPKSPTDKEAKAELIATAQQVIATSRELIAKMDALLKDAKASGDRAAKTRRKKKRG